MVAADSGVAVAAAAAAVAVASASWRVCYLLKNAG